MNTKFFLKKKKTNTDVYVKEYMTQTKQLNSNIAKKDDSILRE